MATLAKKIIFKPKFWKVYLKFFTFFFFKYLFFLQTAIENTLRAYLSRLSDVAGSLITCGPVLNWLELDNRGHRLIVTDDSDINTPAVAAAYVVKRYTAQASDEISFEVSITTHT